jgi:hypothetical protein
VGVGWGSLIWGLFNGLFWAGLWYLCGLIWLAGESGCIGFILAVVRFLALGWMVDGWEEGIWKSEGRE